MVEPLVRDYGDLLFDLCESLLWTPVGAQVAFRKVLKDLSSGLGKRANQYEQHKRAWVLRAALDVLRPLTNRLSRKLSHEDRIELDSDPHVSNRLKQFDAFFHRLSFDEQALLLLKDKYSIPISELSTAFGVPEETLKMMRQQALQSLEQWVWGRA